jgi:dTMP kinase
LIKRLNQLTTQGRKPDVTFLLDCPSGLGLKRAVQRNQRQRKTREERFEREKIQFHHRVRRGYRWIAKEEPHRVKVIDTRKGPDKVFEKIRDIVDNLIGFEIG